MAFDYDYEGTRDYPCKGIRPTPINTIKNKMDFYLSEDIPITIRLKNHNNYFLSGKLIKSEDYSCIMLIKNKKVMINYRDIDQETIIPDGIDPIKEFIRYNLSENTRKKFLREINIYAK